MDMAESHVVSALANKRAEIAGMIARAQQQLGQFLTLIWFIWTLPFVYLLPQWSRRRSHRRGSVNLDLWFEPGGLSRRVLDALRPGGCADPRTRPRRGHVMIDTGLDPRRSRQLRPCPMESPETL